MYIDFEEQKLNVLSVLLNWETAWHVLHMDFKRCVIHWLMGNGCRARRQYGFSEMTEPWGITLKSAPDISRLALYYTRSRSFSLFSLFFSHSHILTFPSFPSVSASSSLLILLFFSLSPPPSLPLFHCPQTACWLNKWPSFILRKQLSLWRLWLWTGLVVKPEPLICLSEMDDSFLHIH